MDKLKCISIIILVHSFAQHNVSSTSSNLRNKFSDLYGDNLNSYWNRINNIDKQLYVEEDISSYVIENGVNENLANTKVCCDMIKNDIERPILCLLFYFSLPLTQIM